MWLLHAPLRLTFTNSALFPNGVSVFSHYFQNKQQLFYYTALASFYKELTLDPLTYVTKPVARVPLKNRKNISAPKGN